MAEVAEVNSVLLEASVQDQKGRFVKGLPPTQFTVLENGVPQSARHRQAGGSWRDVRAAGGQQREHVAADGLRAEDGGDAVELHDAARSDDRRAVLQRRRRRDRADQRPADHPRGDQAIQPGRRHGDSRLAAQVAHSLANAEGRRAIVLITDGYDENSTTRCRRGAERGPSRPGPRSTSWASAALPAFRSRESACCGSSRVETGGRFFFPSREEQLAEVHDTLDRGRAEPVSAHVYARNQTVDGTWRAITVRTTDRGLHHPDARPGYFAPKPPPIRPRDRIHGHGSPAVISI